MNPTEKELLLEQECNHVWHPFTCMQEWNDPAHEPLIVVRGEGVWLEDYDGLRYIDGNSSIWTVIHGHRHPHIDSAIKGQLERIGHSSFLGATHPGAIELAARLAELWAPSELTRVFFSDDGSTAIEAAMKMSLQYWQLKGRAEKRVFAAFQHAYHGDTAGASSLGSIAAFHDRFESLHFPVQRMAGVEDLRALSALERSALCAIVIEPVVQGVAGIRLWPEGMLAELRRWCDENEVLLVADEVLTGFGRTGAMFASQKEEVVPDIVALAKGLTGGYLPLAATIVKEGIFSAFLGPHDSGTTFYYGHSYTANPLACAAALASLDVFEMENTLEVLPPKVEILSSALEALAKRSSCVLETRQCGLIAGIELCQDRESGRRFDPRTRMAAKVCHAARRHGLLTRPIADVVVLMPPLSIREQELLQAVQAIALAINECCGK